MAEVNTYTGVLVGIGEPKPWAFEGRSGTTRAAWIQPGAGEPLEVRCDEEAIFNQLRDAGQWATVEIVAELKASNNQIRRTIVQLVSTKPGALTPAPVK